MADSLRVAIGQHSAPGRAGPNQDFHGAVLPTGHMPQLEAPAALSALLRAHFEEEP